MTKKTEKTEKTKIAFISGHLDLTEDEWLMYYREQICQAILLGHDFIIGDAKGTDLRAQELLKRFVRPVGAGENNVTVYHMLESARNNSGPFKTIGEFETDLERDSAMTADSDYDIAWVRPGREKRGTAKNIKRRLLLNTSMVANKKGEY
jgi:hypothetical protein